MSQSYSRYWILDAARGTAVMAMIGYHFGFDLDYFGFIDQDILNNPRWIWTRIAILSSFLLIAGLSLVLTQQRNPPRNGFHFIRLFLSALLVSAGSYLVFPDSFIYFGVLHFLALAMIIGRIGVGRLWLSLLFAAISFYAGYWLQFSAFNPKYLNWIGMVTAIPHTEDYVPILPWFWVYCLGISLGNLLLISRKIQWLDIAKPATKLVHPFIWCGRHSLIIYLVHQPILFAVIMLYMRII